MFERFKPIFYNRGLWRVPLPEGLFFEKIRKKIKLGFMMGANVNLSFFICNKNFSPLLGGGGGGGGGGKTLFTARKISQ